MKKVFEREYADDLTRAVETFIEGAVPDYSSNYTIIVEIIKNEEED